MTFLSKLWNESIPSTHPIWPMANSMARIRQVDTIDTVKNGSDAG
jgi:hypothetical protein